MSAWYYSQADQMVGPFEAEGLGKLVHAGVINDATLVRQAGEGDWRPLASVFGSEDPANPLRTQEEARYYYLDADDQPVGPFDLVTLHRLHAEKAISADTLVSGVGEPEWIPAGHLLKLPVGSPLAPVSVTSIGHGVHPRYLPFERYVLLTIVTLGLYPFYLVPCQSRDLKAITGRERIEFTALLILGVVTLSLLLLIMQVLYAYDLERHGKAVKKAGRRESLGTIVLVLTVVGVALSFAFDGFLASYTVGTLFGASALWLLQKEINLYAVPPDTVRAA